MERKSSRIFLMYAGAIFLLFSLLACLTLARPESGFLSAVGSIIVNLILLPFFVIGLIIGVALCVAVALGIFVAAAYILDREKGREIGLSTKQAALEQLMKILAAIAPRKFGDLPQKFQRQSVISQPSMTVQPIVDAESAPNCDKIMSVLSQVEDRLAAIDASMSELKAETVQFTRSGQLDEVRAAVREVENATGKLIDEKVQALHVALDEVAAQGGDISSLGRKLDETVARLAKFEQEVAAVAELPGKLSALRDEFGSKMQEMPKQLDELKSELQKQMHDLQAKPAAVPAPKAPVASSAPKPAVLPAQPKSVTVKAQPKGKKK